jgi:hypothetical protein
MRTTLRLDDDLLRDLKREATKQKTTLAELVNRILRLGLRNKPSSGKRARFRQATFAMGKPRFDLDKALALADSLADEETLEKMARRK